MDHADHTNGQDRSYRWTRQTILTDQTDRQTRLYRWTRQNKQIDQIDQTDTQTDRHTDRHTDVPDKTDRSSVYLVVLDTSR